MDNIADLLSGMSEADFDALRQTAENLFSGGMFGNGSAEEASPKQDFGISPELLSKITTVMQAMQKTGDSRSALIAALKPYLSTPRQRRADEAMQMLRLLDVLPLLGNGLFESR